MADWRRPGYWSGRAWRCLGGGSWRLLLCRLLLVSALFGLGALAFVTAGLAPVAASAGHWPITDVLLHYAMRRAVSTRAIAVEPPPPEERYLDERAMVLKGAGHYATGCLPCHGAPGRPRSLIARKMTPPPPYLPPKVHQWSDAELFWIVKHGVKFTAMPAWPAQMREDEVWAMTAFLRRLPELDAQAFEQLAYGPSPMGTHDGSARMAALPPNARLALADCTRCHGRGGGAFPKLAGQSELYLLRSLQAYARGERHSGIMEPIAAGLGQAELHAMAEYFAELPETGTDPEPPAPAAFIARGRRIALHGIPERRIPSCVECHGPGAAPRNPLYPELAGQHADYLALQLKLFKHGQRGGTAYAHIMETVAQSLEPEDIRAVSAYYASLPER
jgi:cytochrome c553